GTRIIVLLVSSSIPKFAQRSLRMLANFGIRTLAARAAALACFALASAVPASAQTVEPFAKSIALIIGLGPGGNYDLWARTLSHHYGKHLPGRPTVVPQYMPGAGSYIAAGHMAKIAPRDGSVIALISRDAVLGPLTGTGGALFDARALSWLGSPTTETNVCIAYRAAVESAQDLFARQLIVADTGPGTGTRTYPKVLGALLGMK